MVADAKQEKLFRKATKDLRDTFDNQRFHEKERARRADTIRKFLRSPKQGLAATHVYLEGIGGSLVSPAQYRLIQGDSAGWRLLDEVLAWVHLAYRIRPGDLREAPEYIAHAYSLGDDRIADDIADGLAARYAGRAKDAQWQHYPLASFIFQLRLRSRGLPLNQEIPMRENPLNDLLDHLFDEDLADRLLVACDRHLVEATSGDGSDLLHYQLYPMEILWVQRIRAERGLPNPELDHPLMNTPLARPPPPDQRPRWDRQDPLYQEVRQRMIQERMLPPDEP